MSIRILVVEDEQEIARYLERGLAMTGYNIDVAPDGPTALKLAHDRPPDLVILDLMLPGMNGVDVARRLRSSSDVPIIMLTARTAVSDRVAGLESGADDYLIKPFAFEELVARVRVQLRRRSERAHGDLLRVGPISMSISSHEVKVGDEVVVLTAKEFEVLELFLRHPNQVLTRDVIYDRVWNYNFGADSNVIEVYIRALRQKLDIDDAARLLQTVRGVGYVLRDQT